MPHLSTPSVPAALYIRGMEQGLLPRAQELQTNDILVRLGRGGLGTVELPSFSIGRFPALRAGNLPME
ncbi:MAG: hypothetical protein OHK0022_01120 [Roseiflexaceae bacterium]